MRKEIREELEKEAERAYPTVDPYFDLNPAMQKAHLSGAEAGFKLGLKAAAEKASMWHVSRGGFTTLAHEILKLGDGE